MTRLLALLVLAMVIALLCVPQPRLSPRDALLLSRATFGPTPADARRLAEQGRAAWLEEQLRAGSDEPAEVRETLRLFSVHGLDPRATFERMAIIHEDEAGRPADLDDNANVILAQMTRKRVLECVSSPHQLRELMIDFWFNHFSVSHDKAEVIGFSLEAYEEAIRRHALGRFRDLLGAVAHSPAMLAFLDNDTSSAAAAGGLNENYARELLELHTIGIDAGYTQRDVREVARCFTGWRYVDRGKQLRPVPPGFGTFTFFAPVHDPGDKMVLGTPIPVGGEAEGERVLDLLAAHPATARFIARKLVRRFVCDDPPEALVSLAAAEFQRTDGDIAATLRVLLTSEALDEHAGAKVKTPLEFVVSSLRAVPFQATPAFYRPADDEAVPVAGDAIRLEDALDEMGAPLYGCPLPTGWPDRAEAWCHPAGLLPRMRFAAALADHRVDGLRVAEDARARTLPLGREEFQRR